jgi:hypothetical protein
VSVLVEEDVFWFEVAVDDVPGVEVLDGEEDFAGVELGHFFGELLAAAQEVEELALSG